MSYALQFKPERVRKDLAKVEPAKDRLAIAAALARLCVDPFRRDLDVRKLTTRDDYRLRVGAWRVTYLIDTQRKLITATSVENRRDAYR